MCRAPALCPGPFPPRATPIDVTGYATFDTFSVKFDTGVKLTRGAFDEVFVTGTAFFITTQSGNKVAWYVSRPPLPTELSYGGLPLAVSFSRR
jgi:hypothetical protein